MTETDEKMQNRRAYQVGVSVGKASRQVDVDQAIARVEKAEAERDNAWNDAIEAALGEIPEHWCSGSQARDRIRALRKDIQNG